MSYALFPKVKVISCFSDIIPDLYFDGISYLDDSIAVGHGGLSKLLSKRPDIDLNELKEGRFWLVYKAGQSHIVCTDDCGQDAVFYYNVDDIWAVSNSFLALVEHLTLHGVNLHLNTGAIDSFFIAHAVGDSLISLNTAVQEIKVLPGSKQIRVSNGRLTVESRYLCGSEKEYLQKEMPNLDVLNRHIIRWSSRLKSLIKKSGAQEFKVDVTGGVDSRLLLGLVLKSDADISKVHFNSNVSWEEDYRIAGLLAGQYGFSLNQGAAASSCGERLSGAEQFDLYTYGSLGVYHKAYFSRFRERPRGFQLHGGGGETLREYYPGDFLSFIDRFEKDFNDRAAFSAVKSNYKSCLDSRSYLCANDHYTDFRCRFHFGRGWYKANESCLITPLLSSDLIREYATLSPSAKSKGYLHLAYYLLVDPEIIEIPFDDSEKSFSAEDVEHMRNFISQWDFPDAREGYDVEVFVGDAPEIVAYPWKQGCDKTVDEMFHYELKRAEMSKFVTQYFSSRSSDYLSSIKREKDIRKRYRKSSHVILLGKMEELGVNTSL